MEAKKLYMFYKEWSWQVTDDYSFKKFWMLLLSQKKHSQWIICNFSENTDWEVLI